MPNSLSFSGIIGEWRTLILAMHYTRDHLAATVHAIEDEDEQNIIFDHISRLDGLIPEFESKLSDHMGEAAASVDPPLLLQQS